MPISAVGKEEYREENAGKKNSEKEYMKRVPKGYRITRYLFRYHDTAKR